MLLTIQRIFMVQEPAMTDTEFWEVMAINVGEARSMPDDGHSREVWGLCEIVRRATLLGLVCHAQRDRLLEQIRTIKNGRRGLWLAYYWPPGAWKPMRKLAELARKNNDR